MRPVAPCLMSALALTLTACGGPAVYEDESFAAASPYEARFATDTAATCEAARRTLLSQGYTIASATAEAVRGTKVFQPDDDIHMELEFNVVCAGTVRDTIAYANAVQTQYELKQSASSAGLSVSGVGSLSLPWTSRNDSLVKVGAETVSDPDFYTRFFKLMENHAPRVGAEKKAAPSRRGNLHDW